MELSGAIAVESESNRWDGVFEQELQRQAAEYYGVRGAGVDE